MIPWPAIVVATITVGAAFWCLILHSVANQRGDRTKARKYLLFTGVWLAGTVVVFAVGFFPYLA
ncbi:hypothetical protein D9M72_586520 [compost metagenome]